MYNSKLFCSKRNPLDIPFKDSEKFTLKLIFPKYWLTWIVILFSFPLSLFPRKMRDLLGKSLGLVIYFLNSKRRNIVFTNLSLCFKEKSKTELEAISKDYFQNLGKSFLDMSILWWKSSQSLRGMTKIENKDILEKALKSNRGVILLTLHSTSLDFGGRSISNYPVISMYKPFRNELINWLVGKSRCKHDDNAVIFPRENFPFKKVVSQLKKPNIFYYIGDEDLDSKETCFADFFDDRKSTLTSVRKIVQLSNCLVIPCVNNYCSKSNTYITYLGRPLENFPTESEDSDTRLINKCFEELILRNPSQYMWSLRIFQNRESGSEYPYKD